LRGEVDLHRPRGGDLGGAVVDGEVDGVVAGGGEAVGDGGASLDRALVEAPGVGERGAVRVLGPAGVEDVAFALLPRDGELSFGGSVLAQHAELAVGAGPEDAATAGDRDAGRDLRAAGGGQRLRPPGVQQPTVLVGVADEGADDGHAALGRADVGEVDVAVGVDGGLAEEGAEHVAQRLDVGAAERDDVDGPAGVDDEHGLAAVGAPSDGRGRVDLAVELGAGPFGVAGAPGDVPAGSVHGDDLFVPHDEGDRRTGSQGDAARRAVAVDAILDAERAGGELDDAALLDGDDRVVVVDGDRGARRGARRRGEGRIVVRRLLEAALVDDVPLGGDGQHRPGLPDGVDPAVGVDDGAGEQLAVAVDLGLPSLGAFRVDAAELAVAGGGDDQALGRRGGRERDRGTQTQRGIPQRVTVGGEPVGEPAPGDGGHVAVPVDDRVVERLVVGGAGRPSHEVDLLGADVERSAGVLGVGAVLGPGGAEAAGDGLVGVDEEDRGAGAGDLELGRVVAGVVARAVDAHRVQPGLGLGGQRDVDRAGHERGAVGDERARDRGGLPAVVGVLDADGHVEPVDRRVDRELDLDRGVGGPDDEGRGLHLDDRDLV
jgi:hypothetical protein